MKHFSIRTNATFNVATLFPCEDILTSDLYYQNTLWRQTLLGCQIIQLIQEVHGFKINYVYQQQVMDRDLTTEIEMYYQNGSSVDLFARPMSLRADVLPLAYPVSAIFDWDFGFTIAYPDMSYGHFYSKPFTRQVWHFLYGMAFFCSVYFYLLKKWENKVKKDARECSYGYELLMVIGAYCQHIPPIEARILSRRTAYLVFLLFAYIVYTYYTSNLLSHLVNDANNAITLQELLESDIECVIFENVKAIVNNNIASIYKGDDMDAYYQKLLQLRPVSMEEGLTAVKNTKTAILSDYATIAPYVRKLFNSNEICNLVQVDVVTNIRKYFFVSKTFPFLDIYKVTILRIKEAGILSRLIDNFYSEDVTECTPPRRVETQFEQILQPLFILMGAYVLCVIILAAEIWHYNRNRVWPYVN